MPKPKHQQTTRRRIVLPDRKRLRSTSSASARLSASDRGRIGGRAGIGRAKARTPEQARAAAAARWQRERLRVEAMIQGKV